MTTLPVPSVKSDAHRNYLLVLLSMVLWIFAYSVIQPFANWAAYRALNLPQGSHLGDAISFFLYDVPKIFLLLSGMIFLITILRTFFSPERTRQLLGGKRQGIGNVLAGMLGIVTPFCSCSAVPLFIGFVESGIPLGVTFSFLIAAPVINEVALALLFGMYGWKIAGLYVVSGLIISIVAGLIIGSLHLESWVEDFVWKMVYRAAEDDSGKLTWNDRILRAGEAVREIVVKVWLYVIIGIGIGAAIHGYVPVDALTGLMGKTWWSVPLVVLMALPLYSNAAGMFPIMVALIEKGAALGTALAFMMAVVGVSLPETVLLRRVLKPKLIALFIGVVTLSIIITGYLFNIIL
ncbi:MAG TPA: permease [Anaerolineales bacterium]|nr:permease [Anaerolineales bacterium]